MSNYKSNSGQDIVYLDLSTSSIGASLYQSSADPASLASIMPNFLLLHAKPAPSQPRIPELHPGAIWISEDFDEPLSDEFWIGSE